LALGFGLVHGFGFSFALRDSLQFAGAHLLTSLLSFNVGVELGQLAVLVVLIPALDLLFRYVVAERMGVIILSAIVAHTGWHWMTERWAVLRQYNVEWPRFDVFSARPDTVGARRRGPHRGRLGRENPGRPSVRSVGQNDRLEALRRSRDDERTTRPDRDAFADVRPGLRRGQREGAHLHQGRRADFPG
jgi:hypothetical protein